MLLKHYLFKALLMGVMTLSSTLAQAEITYHFSGQHALYGKANAILKLKDNYQFGQEITPNNFISLSFNSAKYRFTILPQHILTLYAALNIDGTLANQAGNFQFYLDASQDRFLGTRLDGTWRASSDMNEGVLGKWQLSTQGLANTCRSTNNYHKAAARGDIAYVNMCLKAGVPVNLLEGNGWTALHSAARNGSVPVVRLLLQKGANKTIKDKTGRTAADQARLAKHYDVLQLLK